MNSLLSVLISLKCFSIGTHGNMNWKSWVLPKKLDFAVWNTNVLNIEWIAVLMVDVHMHLGCIVLTSDLYDPIQVRIQVVKKQNFTYSIDINTLCTKMGQQVLALQVTMWNLFWLVADYYSTIVLITPTASVAKMNIWSFCSVSSSSSSFVCP